MIEEEENVKKVWRYFILLVVLSALLCMSVFAAEELPVFTAEDGVAVEATEMQADKFTLTYTKTGLSGECLVLMITQEEAAPASEEPQYTITENTIQYVNQDAAAEGKISFTIYPKEMVNGVILLASQSGIEKLGTVSAPKEPAPAGVTVSGTIAAHATGKDTWLSGDTTITLTKKGEATALQTVTLTTDKGISISNGASAEALEFAAVENGTYTVKVAKAHFAPIEVEITVNDTAVTLESIDLYMWGDVNGDGAVTAADAQEIQRYAAELSSVISADSNSDYCKICADVNDDGALTAADAQEIQRYAAELSSTINNLP